MRLRLIIVFVLLFVPGRNLFAYIDPGAGSMALQIILGAVFVAIAFIKIYWKKLLAFLTRKKNKNTDNED